MAAGFNTSPFVLPNMFDKPGDALQQGLHNQERRADRQSQIDYRNQKDKEADDWRRYQLLKDTLDPAQMATGEITSEQYFDNETKRVMGEVLADPSIRNAPFVDFYGAIQRRWQPVVAAHDRVKTGLNLIDASVKANGQGNDNLNVDDLARDSKMRLINDMIPVDANGRRNYDTANYRPETDYVGDILNSENGWRYLKSGNALVDYIKNFKTTEINPHKQLGDQSIIPYKGRQTPFVKMNVQPNEIGRLKTSETPKYDIATEDDFISEGDQRIPIKVLDKNIYEQHILGNKKNREALDFMWNSYKERNGLVSKNATEDEKRKRAFAVGIFELNDPSEITSLTPQHLPGNTTNNNHMGSGGAGRGGDLLQYDVLGTYENKIQDLRSRVGGKWGDTFKAVRVEDIDKRDRELIDTQPYYDNGATYYKVRPDGDWEGADGQVISWAKVAAANLDKTAANEALRGRTTLTADKTKNKKPTGKKETPAERARRIANGG